MLPKEQLIQEYREKYPTYSSILDRGFTGIGGQLETHTEMETLGFKAISYAADNMAYHANKSIESKGEEKHIHFLKSLPYCALLGLVWLPAEVEILFERGIRKLTGRTVF